MRVYVCHGPNCAQRARPIWAALVAEVQAQALAEQCELIVSGCLSRCDDGPNINVYPNLTKYARLTPEQARRIVREHVGAGLPVTESVFHEPY